MDTLAGNMRRTTTSSGRMCPLMLAAMAVVLLCICRTCEASPKYDDTQRTYPNNQWRRSYRVNDTATAAAEVTAPDAETVQSERHERLGFSTGYGSGTQGYPYSGSGVGVYSPLKLDLGGMVMGAIIGIGALLIVPKLVGVFHSGYGGTGGNYRSAIDSESSGLADMLSKLDDILGKNNIDSTTCVQRVVCAYVRSSEANMSMGSADQSDHIIHTISGNPLVEYMLNGTAIKEALANGKDTLGRDCDTIYPGCPLDRTSINGVLNKFLPNAAEQH